MPEKEGAEEKSTKSVVNKKQKQMMGEEGYDHLRDMGRIRKNKKKKAKEKKKKMSEEKKPLPTTKMYRKAGNLSRMALSKGLDSKEGGKAQKRSEKIVSTISTAKEKERFDKMTTPKAQLRNEEVVDEMMRNKLTGLPTLKPEAKKPKEKPMTDKQRRMMPEGLDPVGKEDGDINNEGKSTKSVVNKKQKQMMGEEGYDIARDMGRVRPSKDKKDATTMPPSKEMEKTRKVNKGPSAFEIVKKKYGKAVMDVDKKKKDKK